MMNEMKLKILERNYILEIKVDGKIVRQKKYGNESPYIKITTNKATIELEIKSMRHELSQKHWLFFSILFYLISIFGLLNPFYSKNYKYFNYKGTIDVIDNPVLVLACNNSLKESKALICNKGLFDDNSTNVLEYHDLAKRKKILRLFKIFVFLAIAIGLVVYIFASKK